MFHLTPAALDALSTLLDMNDDDDALVDAGIDPVGFAKLRDALANALTPSIPPMPRVWFSIGSRVYSASDTGAEWNGSAVLAFTRGEIDALIGDIGYETVDADGYGMAWRNGLLVDYSDDEPSTVPTIGSPEGTVRWVPEGATWELVDVDQLAHDACELAASEGVALSRSIVRDVTRESDYAVPLALVDDILTRAYTLDTRPWH